MKYENLGGYNSIDRYVDHKLTLLSKAKPDFKDLFNLMFSESKNILFEESDGYKINKITYGESKNNVDIIAGNIKKRLGVIKEDTSIAIYLDNSHTWIETFWAILKCGCRPLLLNMRLDDDSLKYAMDITNTKLVISKVKIFPIMTILEKELYEPNDIKIDRAFGKQFLVMSSGTSNNIKVCAYSAYEMKCVLLQSRDIIKSSKQIQKHYNGELKLLTFLPFYHIFGFIAVYLWFAFYSRTFVKLNDLNPSTIQNTIKRHKVTHIFAVPLLWKKTYEAVIKEIKSRGEDQYKKFLKGMKLVNKPLIGGFIKKKGFKQIRDNLFGDSVSYMIAGGSMIDEEVLTFFNAIGYHLSNGYGMSEIGITSVELSEDVKVLNSGSVGKPLHGVMYKVENDELLVKSVGQACYIYENGRVNDNRDKWFHTKDIAKKENGSYFILGRQDDLIVSFTGENLNPNLIEPKLKIENVLDVCIINGKDRELPVVLVSVNKYLLNDKATKLVEDIKEILTKNNLMNQVGKVVLIAEPFIKKNEFKINRKKLENDYFSGLLHEYSLENALEEDNDELTLNIKKMFAVALNKEVEEINSLADFFLDEGGTSLDYFVIVNFIKEQYGIDISTSVNPLHTVRDIVTFLKENL